MLSGSSPRTLEGAPPGTVAPRDHPGSRDRKAALTLDCKRGNAGADSCHLGIFRASEAESELLKTDP